MTKNKYVSRNDLEQKLEGQNDIDTKCPKVEKSKCLKIEKSKVQMILVSNVQRSKWLLVKYPKDGII